MRKANSTGALLLLCMLLQGCWYSFTGVSVPPDVKTISIQQFDNVAPIVVANLTQSFTEKLRDKYLTQTNLSLVSSEGDMQISGSITGYSVSPIAIQGNETAAQNRLQITVRVKYENLKHPEQDWEQTFSNFSDYDSGKQLNEVEDVLIAEINDKLAQDIFNKTLSDW